MEANELRIGNYLTNFLGEVFEANGVTIANFYHNEFGKPEPIKLTEKWLLDFGFEVKNKRQNRFINDDDFELEFQGDYVSYCVWGGEDAPHLTQFFGHCKYVHQLQNLYFALTQKELKINKPIAK